MKHFVCISAILLLLSCSSSPLVSTLQDSDSIAVRFNHPGTDSIVKVVEATEAHAIQKLVQFADGKETKEFKCGYDGNIMFYKKGSLTGDISFNYTIDGCHHFLYMTEGKLTATKMNNEAVDFLKRLAGGKQ